MPLQRHCLSKPAKLVRCCNPSPPLSVARPGAKSAKIGAPGRVCSEECESSISVRSRQPGPDLRRGAPAENKRWATSAEFVPTSANLGQDPVIVSELDQAGPFSGRHCAMLPDVGRIWPEIEHNCAI